MKLGITMVQLGEKDQGCKMISGLKKNIQKQASLCYKKLSMSKKNSNVILKKWINYDQIFQSIKNLASSRDTLELIFKQIYKDTN